MKTYFCITLLLFLFLDVDMCFSQNNVKEKPVEIKSDTLGNLRILTHRIYVALKAYRTGSSELYKYSKEKKDKSAYDKRNSGMITDSFPLEDHPCILVYNKNSELVGISDEELDTKSLDDVESIEVAYAPDDSNLAVYGTRALGGVIKIRFREKEL